MSTTFTEGMPVVGDISQKSRCNLKRIDHIGHVPDAL